VSVLIACKSAPSTFRRCLGILTTIGARFWGGQAPTTAWLDTVVELLNAPKLPKVELPHYRMQAAVGREPCSQSELQELWNDPGLHAFFLTPDKELARAQYASNSAGATS
jgi:hypothetical protein